MSFWGLRHLPGRVQPFAALLLAPLQQVPQPRLRLATAEATAEAMGGQWMPWDLEKNLEKLRKIREMLGKNTKNTCFCVFFEILRTVYIYIHVCVFEKYNLVSPSI